MLTLAQWFETVSDDIIVEATETEDGFDNLWEAACDYMGNIVPCHLITELLEDTTQTKGLMTQ